MPSEAIRGHQTQSEAIKTQFEAITEASSTLHPREFVRSPYLGWTGSCGRCAARRGTSSFVRCRDVPVMRSVISLASGVGGGADSATAAATAPSAAPSTATGAAGGAAVEMLMASARMSTSSFVKHAVRTGASRRVSSWARVGVGRVSSWARVGVAATSSSEGVGASLMEALITAPWPPGLNQRCECERRGADESREDDDEDDGARASTNSANEFPIWKPGDAQSSRSGGCGAGRSARRRRGIGSGFGGCGIARNGARVARRARSKSSATLASRALISSDETLRASAPGE